MRYNAVLSGKPHATGAAINIYHISWTQSESVGLNAVVIAANEDIALQEIDLDDRLMLKTILIILL